MKTIIKNTLFAAMLGLCGQAIMLNARGFFSQIKNDQQWQEEKTIRQRAEDAVQAQLTLEQISLLAEWEKENIQFKSSKIGKKNFLDGVLLGVVTMTSTILLLGVPKIPSLQDRITEWIATIAKNNCLCPLTQ